MAGKSSPKYYAVRKGRIPGIYRTWEECREQVAGFAGAAYKSFPTAQEAADFNNGRSEPARVRTTNAASRKGETTAPSVAVPVSGVVIYADGACIGNPGPGGYGTVVLTGTDRRELSGGFRRTTNNRMEILGCIAGLMTLTTPSTVTIYSDSRYVVNAISESWAVRWEKNGWRRKDEAGEWRDVPNADLWRTMLELCALHRVRFEWVRGHTGNIENERCDVLAGTAAAKSALGIDSGYEAGN